MVRIAYRPLAQAVAAAVFAVLVLGVMLRVGARFEASETLPRYAATAGDADSLAIVRAATDALQGRSSVAVPMVATAFVRQGRTTMVSLAPVAMPGIRWHDVGGTVRILADGRRVIVARQ